MRRWHGERLARHADVPPLEAAIKPIGLINGDVRCCSCDEERDDAGHAVDLLSDARDVGDIVRSAGSGARQEKVSPIQMADCRRRSPRRESIDDHLATARLRFPELAVGTGEGTRAWVRDLIHRRLIGAPYPVKKSVGRGQGVRFTPRDYRALLEILLLRAAGSNHRRTWLVGLWLRGREYPVERVREAVAEDVSAHLKTLRAELNPTGRSTEPFVTKYRRNIAPSRADSPFPDLGGLEEQFAALMMRPDEAAKIPTDMSALNSALSQAFNVDHEVMRDALQELSTSSPEDAQSAVLKFAAVLPDGPIRTIFEQLAHADAVELPSPPKLAGMIDDGRGNSTLLLSLSAASDEQLLSARREIQSLRTGRFERALRHAAISAPAEQAEVLLFFADWARTQRLLHRGNPALAAYLFCVHVQANGEQIPLPIRSPVDGNAVLKMLRDEAARKAP